MDTGIRPKEAHSLYASELNLWALEVTVPARVIMTRISRTLPITPLLADGLRRLISNRPESWKSVPLFAMAEGRPTCKANFTLTFHI